MTDEWGGGATDPGRATFTLSITLGETMRTPDEVRKAIDDALYVYGKNGRGTLTPFAQQPGFPVGFIEDPDGAVVGTWKVEGGI